MTTQKVDMSSERQLIMNLIMSDTFIREIHAFLTPELLKTNYAREVSKWCLDYFDHYKVAPKEHIQEIYLEKKSTATFDEETAESIAVFLQSLSKDYVSRNIVYTLDQAEKYLKLRSLDRHREQIETAIAMNDPTKGEALIANYMRLGRPEGEGISVTTDTRSIADAISMEDEALFTYHGTIGKVCGTPLRGDLTAVLAGVKKGKSAFLWYAAECAMQSELKVAFFSLEMTQRQIVRRAWQSMTATPRRRVEDLRVPYFDSEEDDYMYTIGYKEITKDPTPVVQITDFQKRLKLKFRGGDCRLFAIPGYVSTVDDIISHLDNLHYYEDFDPDVVIVDYADILKASATSGKEYRHQLNDIWLKLRWLARSRNIHVITASQSNKNGLGKDLAIEDVAEDMRKLAHVSSLMALNQTKKEKEGSIIRIADLLQRDEASCFEQVVVLQCLPLGRFCLDSKLLSEVSYDKGEYK